MARRRRKKKKNTAGSSAPEESTEVQPTEVFDAKDSADRWLSPGAILIALLVLVTVCYLPVLRYFFAQDDFMLIFASTHHLGEELYKTFGPVPYHFRPLTEFLYFAGAFRAFGLHPVPYHVISLLIHLINVVLVYLLLRNLRIGAAAALVSSALFGLSVAWLHVVAWITCIQQLVPQTFTLASLLFAVRALRLSSNRLMALAVASYTLALFSYEQQVLLPGMIFLVAIFGLGGLEQLSLRRSFDRLWPFFLVLAIYLAVRLFWKGLPDVGRAKFEYGSNIADNFMTYLGALYAFWPDVTNLIARKTFDFRVTHVALIALIVYQFQTGRWRDVLFALAFIVATLLPASFLVRHYFYYHVYAASFGAIYLLALALQDGFMWVSGRWLKSNDSQLAVAAVLVIVISTASFWRVREIEKKLDTEHDPNRVSFVLHRARLAEKAFRFLPAQIHDPNEVKEIQMLYGRPGAVSGKAYMPLVWALAHGRAVNLLFDDPDMLVSLDPRDVDPFTFETEGRRLFYYDLLGNFYTPQDVIRGAKRAGEGTGETEE